MCEITNDMVEEANEILMRTKIEESIPTGSDGFSVCVTYNGKVFQHHFSDSDIEKACAIAYQKVMCG